VPVAIQCGSCKAKLNVSEKLAGKQVKCPKCGQGVAVPGAAPPVPVMPPIPAAAPARGKAQPAKAQPG
jgi:predicted Zn finger-like uncharacterized protein